MDLLKGACRTGSGSRQSVCPPTKGTISVGTGYTKTKFLHPGNGIGKDTDPGGKDKKPEDVSLVIIPEPGPGLKNSPGTYTQISSIRAPIGKRRGSGSQQVAQNGELPITFFKNSYYMDFQEKLAPFRA